MKKLMFAAWLIAGLGFSAQAQWCNGVIIAGASVIIYNQPVVYNAPVEYNAPVVYNAPVIYNLAPAAPCQAAAVGNACTPVNCQKVVYCGAADSCTVWVPNVSVTYFGCAQGRQQGYQFRGWR